VIESRSEEKTQSEYFFRSLRFSSRSALFSIRLR